MKMRYHPCAARFDFSTSFAAGESEVHDEKALENELRTAYRQIPKDVGTLMVSSG
jgi:hypothetical protein